jgi:hypothetical protein
VGHTLLSSQFQRLRANGQSIPAGPLPLADAFFSPDTFVASGLAPLLRGLARQPAQEIDPHIVDDVRNFLFGAPGQGGFDLASLNLQRGREHGLPGYNQVRVDFGLPALTSFAEVNPDPGVQAALAAAYATVDDIDAWVGGLSEAHTPGTMVGETLLAILGDQFERARDGDRFWYQIYLPLPFRVLVERSTLARIIRRNTAGGGAAGERLPRSVDDPPGRAGASLPCGGRRSARHATTGPRRRSRRRGFVIPGYREAAAAGSSATVPRRREPVSSTSAKAQARANRPSTTAACSSLPWARNAWARPKRAQPLSGWRPRSCQ